jgi:AraC-like DNA-binding protein
MASIYFGSRLIFGVQVITYLLLGLYLLKKYNKRIANFYSNLEGKQLFWVELLTISLLVAAFTSSMVNFLGRNFFVEKELQFIPSAMFSFLLFIIGMIGNKQNQIIKTVIFDENKCQFQHSHAEVKPLLKEKILLVMDREKLFLDPNIRIIALTARLSTNRTYLSQFINTEFGMSFSDFINHYRIKHAKLLIDSDPGLRYSLNHFSEESGFGSISSFNRAFKQFEGVTAGTYRKKSIRKA